MGSHLIATGRHLPYRIIWVWDRALILLIQTLMLYKSFTYLLTQRYPTQVNVPALIPASKLVLD